MKTALICHEDDLLSLNGLAPWLATFSELAGIVSIREPSTRKRRRIRREIERVGAIRFVDVLAFRLYHRLRLRQRERAWLQAELSRLRGEYGERPSSIPILRTASPNSPEAREFLTQLRPDLVLARCKTLLSESIFSIPPRGVFVMHPGVCPEYRNAHGCFWALAHDDLQNVGMTLLRIDRGVDTGPVFGYYSYGFDERRETPFVIQERVMSENLPAIRERLIEIHRGDAVPIDTHGRRSAAWGQPWLSSYLGWRRRASRRGKT